MYKIVHENKVIDVVRIPVFVRFLKTGHISITDRSSAQGILGSDKHTVYNFETVTRPDLDVVVLQPISSAAEFEQLRKAIEKGYQPISDTSILDKAKNIKIKELSSQCKSHITKGFTITLSSGEQQNFKLTAEDQLNLMLIENQLQAGTSMFVYHATNQLCMIYNREDMTRIVQAFRAHTLYHTTYFNIAKHYIKSLDDIEAVNMFQYGMDITSFSTDPIVKQILAHGGVRS